MPQYQANTLFILCYSELNILYSLAEPTSLFVTLSLLSLTLVFPFYKSKFRYLTCLN